jgi:hypothetical protein
MRRLHLASLLPFLLAIPACGGHTETESPADAGTDAQKPIEAGAQDAKADAPVNTQDAAVEPSDAGDGGEHNPPRGDAGVVIGDKVDLLFMIDNSASMGDKQALLREAIPDFVRRLTAPNCVDGNDHDKVLGPSQNGVCTQGVLEFKPITDLHIGVVSSSLGGRGSDTCKPEATSPSNPALSAHNDDRGHLLSRGGANEAPVADAATSGFLAWYPGVPGGAGAPAPSSAITDSAKLVTDFQDIVDGVHAAGCGFEAQLESWYRFLAQPDPYESIAVAPDAAGALKASLVGLDEAILRQRHDFLRPDSVLGIVMLTDENDSTVDPLAVGGQAWAYENTMFPGSKTGGGAARGTSACDTNPNDPACTSCGFGVSPNDPNCLKNQGYYDPTEERLNVRFFQPKRRFGVDPQFPITRYVNGLTSFKVPSRNGEHPNGSANYVGNNDCDNPIFARDLPTSKTADLCHLAPGPRTASQVFLAVIGGVPNQLLRANPSDPNSAQKATLTAADWKAILGNDPLKYDFAGADPHMLESLAPRAGLPGTTAAADADPVHGHEVDTRGNDLQFACTFELPTARDCTNPAFTNECDCGQPGSGSSPLCDATTPTKQVRGKAYPTIRELAVAKELGDRAVISSFCPAHPKEVSPGDPLYGYRPAFNALLSRMRGALQK